LAAGNGFNSAANFCGIKPDMLTTLRIKNLALVSDLTLELSRGAMP